MNSKSDSLNRKFILNFLKILASLFLPILTFPYLTRILEVDGIGKINFAQAISNYFLLVSTFGVGIYGVRSVAKLRKEKNELSKIFLEILILILISTFLTLLIFFIFVLLNKKMKSEYILFTIFGVGILFSNLSVEWFYQGVEEYEYISIRSILFNIISVVFIFFFIRNRTDIYKYALIMIMPIIGTGIVNFLYLRNFINFKQKLSELDFMRHFRPMVSAISFVIITSLYTNLDIVLLGFLTNDFSVGIYSTSLRLIRMIVGLLSAFGIVLIPRISYLFSIKSFEGVNKLIRNSLNITLLITIPSMVGIYMLSNEIILVLAGNGFKESIIILKIISPLTVILPLNNLFGMQLLYPLGHEKKVLISVLFGAIINLTVNIFLIPYFSYIGTSISIVLTEIVVLLFLIFYSRKLNEYKIKFYVTNFIKISIISVVMGSVIYLIKQMELSYIATIMYSTFVGLVIYLLGLIIAREKYVLEYLGNIIRKIKE